MRIHLLLPVFLFVLIATSCNSSGKQDRKNLSSTVSVRYARGFVIEHYAHYTKIDVRNPWDTTKILDSYILIDRNKPKPENLPQGTVVETPITNIALCTAVHAGICKMLGDVAKIKAVCEPNYIDIPEINVGIKNKTIVDLGLSTAINLEKLIDVSPDVLIVSPFENTSFGRLEKTGIPVVQDASYMENSPLGRAEWIKFEAAFLGKDSLAEAIFTKIEQKYYALVRLAAKAHTKPTVFTEMKYGQVWYVPGGKSYMAEFLRDAGANYLWSSLPQSGSVPLSFESVYEKAEKADFWLIKYNNPASDLTYADLQNDYKLYANFQAFRQKNVFTINSAKVRYYDEGPMQPDVILEDLVAIFHPELVYNRQLVYYRQMK